MINRAYIWHSSDEWNFQVKGDFIIIENTSNGKVLGIKDSDEVSIEDANNTTEQFWKKEDTQIEGFFILKNSKSYKVLSAKIKSKYKFIKGKNSCFICKCFGGIDIFLIHNAQLPFSNV